MSEISTGNGDVSLTHDPIESLVIPNTIMQNAATVAATTVTRRNVDAFFHSLATR